MSEEEKPEEVMPWLRANHLWGLRFAWPAGISKEAEGAILFGTVMVYLRMNYASAKVEEHVDPDWVWVTLFFKDPYEKVKEMLDTISIDKNGNKVISSERMMIVRGEAPNEPEVF